MNDVATKEEATFRAFIAISLPDPVRDFLVRIRKELQASGFEQELGREGRVIWARPETLHLTIRFLGEITEEKAAQVAAAMDEVAAAAAPFQLRLSGLGGAPKLRAPRVLWAEPAKGRGYDSLLTLEKALSGALAGLGFPAEDRPYRPHLTLARVKWEKRPRSVSQYVTLLCDDAFNKAMRDEKGVEISPVFDVYTYSLFGSRLTPKGPIHNIRHSAALGRSPGEVVDPPGPDTET